MSLYGNEVFVHNRYKYVNSIRDMLIKGKATQLNSPKTVINPRRACAGGLL